MNHDVVGMNPYDVVILTSAYVEQCVTEDALQQTAPHL